MPAHPLYFEELRTAEAELAAGLVRPGPPAPEGAIEQAQARLGRPLPASYAEFLRSFDGADLFHEAILVAGVGPQAPLLLQAINETPPPGARAGDLVFALGIGGDSFVFEPSSRGDEGPAEPRVVHVLPDSEERWLAGSSFSRWLSATLAREQLLYDSQGEFLLEAFEPDGEELTPRMALRRAERGVRKDPDAAEAHHDLGVAWRRAGRLDRAVTAFARAAALDPENPWPWFDLGRAHLAQDHPRDAAAAFRNAAAPTPGPEGARLWAWAARASFEAGDRAGAEEARRRALDTHPDLVDDLRRGVDAATETGDAPARTEAEALLQVFDRAIPLRQRLTVVAPSPPPAAEKEPRTRQTEERPGPPEREARQRQPGKRAGGPERPSRPGGPERPSRPGGPERRKKRKKR